MQYAIGNYSITSTSQILTRCEGIKIKMSCVTETKTITLAERLLTEKRC
jgi:hypothetical protein